VKQWVIPAWIPVAVVAAVALVLASARDIDRTFQETFANLEPGTRLVLRHGDGDVIVVPWERDAIEVDVDYHVSVARLGFGSLPDLDVDLRRYGETVEVLGRERGTVNVGILFFSREHEHVYRIKAPPWVRLELSGSDGDVHVDDWTGVIESSLDDGDVVLRNVTNEHTRIRTRDGDLTVAGYRGELTARVDDGDLRLADVESPLAILQVGDGLARLRGCRGEYEIRNNDGKVELQDHVAGRLEIRADDADVDLSLRPGATPDIDVEVSDGTIRARVAPDVSARFWLTTRDGHVDVNHESARDLVRDEHSARGSLGDGAGSIRIRTRDGSVELTGHDG
jgi:hypothetical protein